MTIKSSLLFARSLIFPKTEKKSSARRSLLGAMLCIGLSIVPLIVVISITNGMIEGMTERLIGLSTGNLKAYISSNIKEVKSQEKFLNYVDGLNDIQGITKVYPEVQISALALGKDSRVGIEIRALPDDIFSTNEAFSKFFNIIEGDLSSFTNAEKTVVIGQKISEDLNLHPGDDFKIITTKSVSKMIVPKLSTFKISAVVSSGFQELDQFWVFVPINMAFNNFNMGDAAFCAMIDTKDAFATDLVRIQHDARKYFGKYANVYRWDEINASEFENYSSTKVMLVFVMFLIVLVASVNISSAIIMLVMERQKEIAILKSIGGTPKGITFSFLTVALACSFGGLLIGVPVGVLFTVFSNQIVNGLESVINFFTGLANGSQIKLMDPAYYLSEIPVYISAGSILIVIAGVLILSIIVSYIPARKAGKEKPLDILRKN